MKRIAFYWKRFITWNRQEWAKHDSFIPFFLSPWQPEVSLNKFQSTFQYAHLSVIESNLINKCYVINDDGLVLYACLFIGGSAVLSGVGMEDANDDENAVINGENDDNVVYAMKTRKTH